jgi:hypothetical protein
MDIRVKDRSGRETTYSFDINAILDKTPARVVSRDDRDGWPSARRAQEAKLQSRAAFVPVKKHTKLATKTTDPRKAFETCGPGSDSNKGPKAYAGLLRAIHATGDGPDNGTGCIVATSTQERRLKTIPTATTLPRNGGMQFVNDKLLQKLLRRMYA